MGSTGASLRASLLPDSRKGLLNVGARKEKEKEDPVKHRFIQTQLVWSLATFSSHKQASFYACHADICRVFRL